MDDDAPPSALTDSELQAIADTAEHGVWLTARRDDVLRLVAECRRLRAANREIKRAAQRLVNACPRPDDEDGRRIRDEAVALLSGRTLVPSPQRSVTSQETPLTDIDLHAHSKTGDLARRVVDECRRLRSDDWLLRATDAIGNLDTREGYVDTFKVLAILRKHRDGER